MGDHALPGAGAPVLMQRLDNLRIASIRPVATPASIQQAVAVTRPAADTVQSTRQAIADVLAGEDSRLLVVVGPCSIHDPDAALDYARRLAALRRDVDDQLLIVMRVYFEKPRTTVGWKGLINDPHIDDSFDIDHGLRTARQLLVDLNAMGMPAGVEFLDLLTPQYLADLVSWGAIGARTTESQLHREMASGMSCPVGFKNGTNGSVRVAVDAVTSARNPHRFLSLTKTGVVSIFETTGNQQTHVILRGGSDGPNYDAAAVDASCALLANAQLPAQVMIDCSHANSGKKPENQPAVARDCVARRAQGDKRILGLMIESHLEQGRQDTPEVYGKSITDACLGWDNTSALLRELADTLRNTAQAA